MSLRNRAAGLLLLAPLLAAPSATAQVVVGAGCGENGPTRSAMPPGATVRVAALATAGHVRLEVESADQTAGASATVVGDDGVTIARTAAGTYSCVEPRPQASGLGVPLTKAGRSALARDRTIAGRGVLALVNGSGVRRDISFWSVIVDARLLARARRGRCQAQVAAPARVERGEPLGIAVRACSTARLRVVLVALDGERRGKVGLRHTFAPDRPGPLATVISIGAARPGRYRVVLQQEGRTVARGAAVRVSAPGRRRQRS